MKAWIIAILALAPWLGLAQDRYPLEPADTDPLWVRFIGFGEYSLDIELYARRVRELVDAFERGGSP